MKTRVTNSSVRWLVLAGIGVASGFVIFGAVRHAIAQYWANSPDASQWMRAAQLEPANPENWYRLGRYRELDFENTDIPLAISFYRRAIDLDRVSALYWMDLAGTYDTAGRTGEAEQAYRTALQDYPISGEVSWRFGNFLLRQGRVDEALQQIQHAVAVKPALTMSAVSVCWRSTQDINRLLTSALPENPDAYWGAINFFVSANLPDQAVAVWHKLVATKTSLPLEKAYPLMNFLASHGRADNVRGVWAQTIAAAGIKPNYDPPGSLIWNGGFESDLLNGGLSWRYSPMDGVMISFEEGDAHSGNRSLRLDFDGSSNVNFQNISQWVVVQPNTHYRFSAFVRSDELTTDHGVFFLITDRSHPDNPGGFKLDPARTTTNTIGSQPWTADNVEFTTGPDTRLLEIALCRTPSEKLGNKIKGTAWVDDVSLVPEPAAQP